MKIIRIATRKSPLALWQANRVKEQLEEADLRAELVEVETEGDRKLETSISEIGSKGVFTQELEALLSSGEVDIAVHSAKDLQSDLPEGFDIISIGEREGVNDVLVSTSEIDLSSEVVIGTSSTRRVAQFGHHYPHIKTTSVRGNLETRINKMKSGECDALILARAGVMRMGYEDLIVHEFPLEQFTPQPGQGSIAIEAFESIHPTIRKLIKAATNHSNSFKEVNCERAFLQTLGGGCSIPTYAHCMVEGETFTLRAGLLSLDGQQRFEVQDSGDDGVELGKRLAEEILTQGGDQLLRDIQSQLGYL